MTSYWPSVFNCGHSGLVDQWSSLITDLTHPTDVDCMPQQVANPSDPLFTSS